VNPPKFIDSRCPAERGTNTPPAPFPGRLLRLPGVLHLLPLGRSAWLDLVREKKAPQPVKIGRATFWVESEVQEFIAERVRASKAGNAVQAGRQTGAQAAA
jgi:prophage regulatory protein